MSEHNNTNKYTNDDLDDITLDEILGFVIANCAGDIEAAGAFADECRERCDREHLLVGGKATVIVRGYSDAAGPHEYTCTLTPDTRQAVLKSPGGAEIALTMDESCVEFLRELRAGLTGNEAGEGPEIVLDETQYIDLDDAVAPRITFAQLVELAEPHLDTIERARLLRHRDGWDKYKHTHELPGNDLHLVACDAPSGKLYYDTPSLQCEISLAARRVIISRHGVKPEGSLHLNIHPAPEFFTELHQVLEGKTTDDPTTTGDDLPYPDEKSFSDTKNDKKTAQFELWHNTAALNTLLRGLVEKNNLVGRELDVARGYIRNIAAQSDFYCMLIRGGVLQIVCLGPNRAPSQTVMISMSADTVMIAASGAGANCPLAPEYKRHIAATLAEHKKDGWIK
ncbi:hypothetical protein M2103_000326 [Ereboglobus sp. PH5-5]|uniref:hypothetical protein n=1 Tax=Ereboglobus sp. PH5-5 TaxID=2940529 RepID=UPI002406F141|nr:hypothetical protein [Ereboglobus sp. PH5-5]MDF9832118.1 hypothetical protein [Ereboglobus sp. PH5-5]